MSKPNINPFDMNVHFFQPPSWYLGGLVYWDPVDTTSPVGIFYLKINIQKNIISFQSPQQGICCAYCKFPLRSFQPLDNTMNQNHNQYKEPIPATLSSKETVMYTSYIVKANFVLLRKPKGKRSAKKKNINLEKHSFQDSN